jgi:hypothetical protein
MAGKKGMALGNLNASRIPTALKSVMTMKSSDGRTRLVCRIKEVAKELGILNGNTLDYALLRRFVVAEVFVQHLDEQAIDGSIDAATYINAVNMFSNLRKQLFVLSEEYTKKEKQSWKEAQESLRTTVKTLRQSQDVSPSSTPMEG